VSDPPVLSYSQLLCKIPFGGRICTEMNVISIATRTAVKVITVCTSVKHGPPTNWALLNNANCDNRSNTKQAIKDKKIEKQQWRI
jgi:hypothetical protein